MKPLLGLVLLAGPVLADSPGAHVTPERQARIHEVTNFQRELLGMRSLEAEHAILERYHASPRTKPK